MPGVHIDTHQIHPFKRHSAFIAHSPCALTTCILVIRVAALRASDFIARMSEGFIKRKALEAENAASSSTLPP